MSRRLRRAGAGSPHPSSQPPPAPDPNTFVWPPAQRVWFAELVALQTLLSKTPQDPVDYTPKLQEWESRMNSGTRMLPGKVERELADNFAFLAAAHPGEGDVMAVCIEERELRDGGGLRFRVAGQEGINSKVLAGLRSICKVLRRVTRSRKEEHAREAVWRKVLSLETAKVHGDLHDRFRSRTRPLDELFNDSFRRLPLAAAKADDTGREALQDIFELCKEVVNEPVETSTVPVEKLLDACYRARRSRSFKRFVKSVQSHKQLVQTIERLGRYKSACHSLVAAARKHPAAFNSIDVEPVPDLLHASLYPRIVVDGIPNPLKTASAITSLPQDEVLRRLRTLSGLSEPRLFTKYTELCTDNPHIHAEIQLVKFYEENPNLKRPDFIGSSKKACYLCSLFLETYGKFGVSKSHQNLYPRWVIPKIQCRSAMDARRFDAIVERMAHILEVSCRSALGRQNRDNRPYAPTSSHGGSTALLSTVTPAMTPAPDATSVLAPSPMLNRPNIPSSLRVPDASSSVLRKLKSDRNLRGRSSDKGNASLAANQPKKSHSHKSRSSSLGSGIGNISPSVQKLVTVEGEQSVAEAAPAPQLMAPSSIGTPRLMTENMEHTQSALSTKSQSLGDVPSPSAVELPGVPVSSTTPPPDPVELPADSSAVVSYGSNGLVADADKSGVVSPLQTNQLQAPPADIVAQQSASGATRFPDADTGLTSMEVQISKRPDNSVPAAGLSPHISQTSLVSAFQDSELREQRRIEKGKFPADAVELPATATSSSGSSSSTDWLNYPYATSDPNSLPQETEYTLYLAGHYEEGLGLGDELFCGKISESRRQQKQGKGFRLEAALRPRGTEKISGRRLEQKEFGVLRVYEVMRAEEMTVLDIVFPDAILRLDVWWDGSS